MNNRGHETHDSNIVQTSLEISREVDISSMSTAKTTDLQMGPNEKKTDIMTSQQSNELEQKMDTDVENRGNPTMELVPTEDNATIPGLDIPEAVKEVPATGSHLSQTNQSSETGNVDLGLTGNQGVQSTNSSLLDSILSKHNLVSIDSGSSEGDSSSEGSTSEESSTTSGTSSDSDSESESASSSDSADGGSSSSSGHSAQDRITKEEKKLRAKVIEMTEEAGVDSSDDEGPKARGLTTVHEITAPQIVMPSIKEVPHEEPITLIGEIKSVIDNVVVVKSKEHGMQRVLDTDSLLVLEDRRVLGFVFETFGPLKNPFYSIRFPTPSDIPSNVTSFIPSEGPTIPVYCCPQRSNFAYTAKIKLHKGNDASNIYDEEVAEDEIEFSDDEAEMEWRRNRKGEAKLGEKRRRGAHTRPSRASPSRLNPLGDQGPSTLSYEEDGSYPPPTSTPDDPYADPYDNGPSNASRPQPGGSKPRPNNWGNDRHAPATRGFSRGRGRGRGGSNSNAREFRRGGHQGVHPQSGHYLGTPNHHFDERSQYSPSFPGMMGFGAVPGGMNPSSSYNNAAQWAHQGPPIYAHPLQPQSYMAPGVQTIPTGTAGPSPGAYINPQFAMRQMFNEGAGTFMHSHDQNNPPS
ncbi:hypothetical protein FRC16_000616 [Serendipita sp. 398]|nr:hypothetical protein FRC16_000616 [Serendipita sp. 398]